jgi:glycosidase
MTENEQQYEFSEFSGEFVDDDGLRRPPPRTLLLLVDADESGDEGGDELHVLFDFIANQALYLALVREEAEPLARALEARPAAPEANGWATFVRNHDELTLDKLTDAEREEVFAALAPQEDMRIFGRGIRRRVPPMLAGDRRRIELVYSLLFSLPGMPVLLYGEEIGMGENRDQDKRHAVRTPMQWSAERNGGFSQAAPSRLVASPPSDGYAPEHVNVEAQMHDTDSLFSTIRGFITRFRSSPEIGWGRFELLETGEPAVMAHRITEDHLRFVAVHNFSPRPVTVGLELAGLPEDAVLSDLFEATVDDIDERGRVDVQLDAYGYRWFRILAPGDRRIT